jgi:gentisate 1,2-dioxygenase
MTVAIAAVCGVSGAALAADPFAEAYAAGRTSLTAWLISSGPDGESHMKEIKLNATEHDFFGVPKGLKQYMSEKPESFSIFSAPGNIDLPAHTTNRREMFIILRGSSVMTLGDGTRKEFHAGDITIFQDDTGHGHSGRTGPGGYTAINVDLGPITPAAGAKK